jgi:prephenate dehydratase
MKMADRLRKVDYFYVMVPNTAGQGSKVLAGLAAEGVNLLAFSGFPSRGKGQLDLVPENSAKFRRAARKLKLKLSKRKTGFLLQGSDRVGAMTKTLKSLAAAKINVTAMDAVTGGDGRFGAIFWVKPKKVAKAAKLLHAR